MSCHVLINYPLSTKYKSWLEQELNSSPNYVSIPELRRRPISEVYRFLRSLTGERLVLPLEDENSLSILPILHLIASATRAKRIEIIFPDQERKNLSRWRVLPSLVQFARATIRCTVSVIRADRELKALVREPILEPHRPASNRIMYLNANLWFGVKAGGSVGHISGVANGFLDLGYEVDFLSAGGKLMVRPEADYLALEPPPGYGLPYDGNYYAFHYSALKRAEQTLAKRKVAFLYQRMSVANYTGVVLSRKFRLPLVLEYNGSEVWVAKNWGRPLSHPLAAQRAEEACLRHANAIVTVSEVLRDELVKRGTPAEKIITYPNCIDEKVFDPQRFTQTNIINLRARYGLAPDALVVSFLGTFGPWHGVEVMGEAIRILASAHRKFLEQAKVYFLIVGDGVNMGKLQRMLSGTECRGFYSLPGLVPQEEAPLHVAAADILLSPHVANSDGTRFFGSPTKLFEYMAMGKAIIASDLDQIGQILKNSLRSADLPPSGPRNGETRVAILCPPSNSNDLAKSIRFLLRNHDWREVLGQNARREALAKYTWRHHVQVIENKLRTLKLLGANG